MNLLDLWQLSFLITGFYIEYANNKNNGKIRNTR